MYYKKRCIYSTYITIMDRGYTKFDGQTSIRAYVCMYNNFWHVREAFVFVIPHDWMKEAHDNGEGRGAVDRCLNFHLCLRKYFVEGHAAEHVVAKFREYETERFLVRRLKLLEQQVRVLVYETVHLFTQNVVAVEEVVES